MKKSIIIICIITSVISISAIEAHKPFKPLSEFQNDAIVYLKYNYGDENTEILKGKTVKEFLNNSDVEFTTFKFTYDKDNKIDGLILLLQSYSYIIKKHDDWKVSGVWLFFSPKLTNDDFPEIFGKFYDNRGGYFLLTPENKTLLEVLIISENGMAIMMRSMLA